VQVKGDETMPNETAAILEIMQAVGIYDFVVGKVQDQAETVELFKDDFESLVSLCQK
jgi:hypothetical protein